MSPPPGGAGVGLGVPLPGPGPGGHGPAVGPAPGPHAYAHGLTGSAHASVHGGPPWALPLPISALPARARRARPVPLPLPIYAPPAALPDVDAESDYPTPTRDRHHGHDAASVSTVEEDDPPGGKKRKVPVPLVPGSDADVDSGRDGADRNPPRSAREDGTGGAGSNPMALAVSAGAAGGGTGASGGLFPLMRRLSGSSFAMLLSQRRALFQKRKAGMIALYLDAQGAVESKRSEARAKEAAAGAPNSGTSIASGTADRSSNAGSTGGGKPATGATANDPAFPLPDVGAFERLLPVLEDMDTWAPDAPGWRDGDDAAKPVPRRTLERWRTGFARRKRLRLERVPVARGGWAPEGSFELDIPTNASSRTRSRARERVALARLAEQLRGLILASNKLPSQPEPSPRAPSPPILGPVVDSTPLAAKKSSKKKKKKKKRTTLANEGNPHHVDKYRPSRPVPVSDPYEPWPHHASMLFPPPMRVLAARPGGKDVRPAEDEYICVSCQYALFYGSEAQRRHAIKQRRDEIARREKLRARMYDHTGSNRSRRHSSDTNSRDEGDDDLDDDEGAYEDDEDDGDDDCGSGHGLCTCGRALEADRPKAPDKPP